MAKYRKISPSIWNDAKVRGMSDQGKLALLFMLTHPHMTALGAMRGNIPGLACELGWTPDAFRDAFLESWRQGIVRHDDTAFLIWFPNFLRHNPPESPNVVKSWVGAHQDLPECSLKHAMLRHVAGIVGAVGPAFRQAFGEAFREGLAKAMANQEQEQEQDKIHTLTSFGYAQPSAGGADAALTKLADPEALASGKALRTVGTIDPPEENALCKKGEEWGRGNGNGVFPEAFSLPEASSGETAGMGVHADAAFSSNGQDGTPDVPGAADHPFSDVQCAAAFQGMTHVPGHPAGQATSPDAGVCPAEALHGQPSGEPDTEPVGKSACPACPQERIVALYHDLLPVLPRMKTWAGEREKHLRARWRERWSAGRFATRDEGIAYFEKLFRYVEASDFLMGRVTGRRDREGRVFTASLDWLVRAGNFAKLIEGRYHDREAA